MKIIGILGSSRNESNTEVLLDAALEEAQNSGAIIDKIPLKGKSIAPCDGCGGCLKTGKCVIEDDGPVILAQMVASDGIIWATPVYFWSMTGQTKTLLDRTFALLFPKLQLANKVGGLITVAGNRGCMNLANIFNQYFNYNHMFSAEFAMGYAHAMGDIKKDAFALNMAKTMSHQMISLINADLKFPKEFDTPLLRYVKDRLVS